MTDTEYLKKYLPKEKLEEGLNKLKKGIPVQYIVGNVDFLGSIINVNENVLIPRFETELLVEKTVKYAKEYLNKNIKIIDLGTGSGAIAISLKKGLNANVEGVDISKEALEVAQQNAKLNKVDINFYQSDMWDSVKGKYDLIISNPPYIAYDEKVEDIVKNNEPHLALYADDNGLYFYKKILKEALKHLNKPGIIAFEIGMNQARNVTKIAEEYFDEIITEKDLTGKDRYIFIINK